MRISLHSPETILRWVEHEARKKPGTIRSIAAVAQARLKDGDADALIDTMLEAERTARDVEPVTLEPMPGELDANLLARFLESIRGKVNATTFSMWFTRIGPLSRDGDVIYLRVPDTECKTWITQNYFDVLEEVLRELELSDCSLAFLTHQPMSREAGAA